MALQVVYKDTKMIEPTKAVVVLEGDTLDELNTKSASDLACRHASMHMGLGSCGINNYSSAYLPTPDGRPVETPEDILRFQQETVLHGGKYPYRPRREFTVQRSHLGF